MATKATRRKRAGAHADAVLGRLVRRDGTWGARLPLKAARKHVTFDLGPDENDDGGDAPPDGAAVAAARALVGRRGGIEPLLTDALWAYYQQVVVRHYRMQMDPKEAALTTPDLKRPAEVWRLVGPNLSLSHEPGGRRGKARVRFSGNCDWDEEHGFEVFLDGAGRGRISMT